jgi:hypothetical protein
MNAPRSPRSEEPRMRRSTKVALVLLGTAGAIGVVTAIDAWRRARDHDGAVADAPQPPPTPVSTDRVYSNNEYIPGVGYYHAPFFSWYPFPLNFHDPARGYFSGGLWRAAPLAPDRDRSSPSTAAVAAALAAQQAMLARQAQSQPQARTGSTSGFFSGGPRGSGGSWFGARPGASPGTAPSAKPGIQRGGFGSSSHGSGGGAS